MSQQINGVVSSDALKSNDVQKTPFELEVKDESPSFRSDICSRAQMTTPIDVITGNYGSEAEVSVKLEVCSEAGFGVPDNSGKTEKTPDDLAIEYQGGIKSRVDGDVGRDVQREHPEGGHGHEVSDKNLVERSDENFDQECSGDSGRANVYETLPSGTVSAGRRRPIGRPKGRRSAGRSNFSCENYNSEDANSPTGSDFWAVDVTTAFSVDSRRGVVTERRKRGRPRGSRGSGRVANTFEGRILEDVTGVASDSGDTELIGANLSDSGLGGSVIGSHPIAITRIGRGALRPGCKSYRGRAASIGRGFRVTYGGETASSWEVDTGVIPMEYESASCPTTDAELSSKRRFGLSDNSTATPRAKRGRGARGRPRGRPRKLRTSIDRDSAMDNDSSDFGTPGFDTPDLRTNEFESPDVEGNTGSESETPQPVKSRRGRGRGSRGGRDSSNDLDGAKTKVYEEKIVTCAVCKETMTQSVFGYHKVRMHNNCTWREGIDTPLDLSDDRVIKPLLKQALQKRKHLTCEKCGISRSSLVGYESHITFCAKTEGERDALMETCPVCARRMMPSSLKVHMGVHRQEEKTKLLQEDTGAMPESPVDPGEGSSTSTGKIKRAAANRAVSLMQIFIKGEDMGAVEVPSTESPVQLNVADMYEKNKEGDEEDEESPSSKGRKSLEPSLYRVAAWMRIVQKQGKASCKNPGCTFSSSDRNELIEHYKSCEKRPTINYLCKMCNFGCEEEEVMRKHVSSEHMPESDAEDDVVKMDTSESEETTGESEWESDESMEQEGAKELEGENEEKEEKKKRVKKKRKEEKKVKEQHKEKDKIEEAKEEGKIPKTVKYTRNVDFLAKHGLYRHSGLHAYIATLHWNLEFQLANHSLVPLYTEWRPYATDWHHVNDREIDSYLPKARTSLQFARLEIFSEMYMSDSKNKHQLPPFNHLPLFGSCVESTSRKNANPGFITIFAGGPVWAQAWCPMSLFANCYNSNKEGDIGKKVPSPVSQFLAVSCTPDFDSYHPLGSCVKDEKFIIQIWDCGPLTNIENNKLAPPRMALGIAHEYGAVWALEWCPSGCYDVETELKTEKQTEMDENGTQVPFPEEKEVKPLRRLGLLAAACGDGTIRIFSVPFPSELTKSDMGSDSQEKDTILGDTVGASNEVLQTPLKNEEIKEVRPLERTNFCEEGDGSNENECVEAEKRIGGNKCFRSSKKKPSKNTESVNQSALSMSISTEPNKFKDEKSGVDHCPQGMNRPFPIFKSSCVITLVVNSCSNDEENDPWQCLCLSWSLLGKSHSVLAAGFSNGLIALWDLATSSPLLLVKKPQKDGRLDVFLRPYHMFFAHKNSVTAIALAACTPEERTQTGEKYPRYLVSGSRDRLLKVWDLQDTTSPVSSYPRGLVTSLTWLTNWISFMSSIDDSFACARANTKVQALRQYGYKPSPLLNQNSPVMSVVSSDWLNVIAHGTGAGEACILAAHQVLLAVESSKVIKNRRTFVYYTELIDLLQGTEKKENDDKAPGNEEDKTAGGSFDVLSSEVSVLLEEQLTKKKIKDGCVSAEENKTEVKSKTEKKKLKKNRSKKHKGSLGEEDVGVGGKSKEDEVKVEEGVEKHSNMAEDNPQKEFKENPRTYAEATKKFGILFCDLAVDQEVGKLPKEAVLMLQQIERMKTFPVDLYPISAINKMSCNPNMQSFIWLASGHQSGLVRICRLQKTRSRTVEVFEVNAQKRIQQVFMQKTKCSR